MAGRRAETLLEVLFFVERFTLRPAWDDLTDEEFLWEPVPGCWSVRPVAASRTATPFVRGTWEADFDAAAAWAAAGGGPREPMTTIGWLFWHFGSMPGRTAQLDFLGGDHPTESGWSSPYIADHPVFPTAGDAVAAVQAGWRDVGRALGSATDEQLERRIRFPGYGDPGPEGTGAQVVAAMLNEVSHHAAQVTVLRDLFRQR